MRDPSEMGDALVGQAAEWFPADCLVSQYRTARRSRSSSRSGDPATSMKTPFIGLERTVGALIALDSSPSTEFSAL